MKKKVLGLLLICIIVIGLTGCGNKSEDSKSSKKSSDSKEIELYPVKVEEMEDYRGRYGYVDKKGNWIIEPQYISASSFDPETGLAKVRLPKGDYAVQFINNKGDVVIDGCGSYDTHSFKNGYAVVDTDVRVNTYSTSKLVDKDGKTIIDAGKYEIMSDVSKDGILMVSEDTVSTVKFIKLDGSVIHESTSKGFQSCSGFNSKGYGYCRNIFFNVNGNEFTLESGNIQYLNDNNYGFIENSDYMNAIYVIKDNTVEIISDYKYKTTKGFNDQNYSMVRDSNDTPYYLINEKGEKVNNNTYKSVNALNDGKWVVTLEDGSNQVLNPDGSILVNTFKVSK